MDEIERKIWLLGWPLVLVIAVSLILIIGIILLAVGFAAQAAEFGREGQFLPLVANGWPGVPTPTPLWMGLPTPTLAPTMDAMLPGPTYPPPLTPGPGGE